MRGRRDEDMRREGDAVAPFGEVERAGLAVEEATYGLDGLGRNVSGEQGRL